MGCPARAIREDIAQRYPGAEVVARGRSWIKHRVGADRFVWTGLVGPAPLHFGTEPYGWESEIDTEWAVGDPVGDAPWLYVIKGTAGYDAYFGPGTLAFDAGQIVRYVHVGTGEAVAFQPLQLQWSNDLDQIEPVGDVQAVDGVVAGDEVLFAGAYGAGLDFRWQAQAVRLWKGLRVEAGALGVPPAWMDEAGLCLKLQFVFGVSPQVTVWIDGQQWNKNTRTVTGNEVEFRYGDVALWSFKAPRAVGFDGAAVAGEQVFRKSGNNLIVEVRVPWVWLQGAVYPVVVDPTVNEVIGASADDAQESTVGFVTVDGSYVAASQAGAWCGFRFQTVAAEGTCNNAYLSIWCANSANDDPDVVIYAEDEDDVAAYSAGATSDISGRTYTTASTVWQATGIGTGYVQAPDLVDEVQEVFDRGGWSSGNDMGIAYEGQSSSAFTVTAWDGNPDRAAKLDIDYTSGEAEAASLLALLGVGA